MPHAPGSMGFSMFCRQAQCLTRHGGRPSPEVHHHVLGLEVRESQVIPQLLLAPMADESI